MSLAALDEDRSPLTAIGEAEIVSVDVRRLRPSPLSLAIYGDPDAELEADGLLDSIRAEGILVPLVVVPADPEDDPTDPVAFELLSGHRRLACALRLGLAEVPCTVRLVPPGPPRVQALIDYNRQRQKTFRQRMLEADTLEELLGTQVRRRRNAGLKRGDGQPELAAAPVRLNLDERETTPDRPVRTDTLIARAVGIRSKDTYRQARAVWASACDGDVRACAALDQLDAGSKTIHAAYKDLRRRDRFTAGFKPTPYDVWSFRHDPAFGIPHAGAIPAAIVAHAIYYFSPPGGLVVDPMAGGGTTLDVAAAMGRRCLAYDLHPVRPEIAPNDLLDGLPPETQGCDLLFCDPPYHTMRAGQYPGPGVGERPLTDWFAFLQSLARIAFSQLRPGGFITLLVANQTERDIPAGYGYLDHAFLAYTALLQAGLQPYRRISCPMAGGYTPQQVRRARDDGRLLGLVRDLVVMRKPDAVVASAQPLPAP